MTVTNIEYIDNKKSRIYIDNEKAFVLYRGELSKFDINLGAELSEASYNIIMYDVLKKRVRLRAMHILERQEKTKKQLIDKLYKNEYPQELIEDAVAYVESYNYINDERYAKQYIRCGCQKKSKRQLIMELQRRGIDKNIIITAYEDVCEENNIESNSVFEKEAIKKIIDKKLPDLDNAQLKDKQRVYRYLLSKGFSASDISRQLVIY